jgi:hypothetical protein
MCPHGNATGCVGISQQIPHVQAVSEKSVRFGTEYNALMSTESGKPWRLGNRIGNNPRVTLDMVSASCGVIDRLSETPRSLRRREALKTLPVLQLSCRGSEWQGSISEFG